MSATLDPRTSVCLICADEMRTLYRRLFAPCERCSADAIRCRPRTVEDDPLGTAHLWLCAVCADEMR